MLWTLDHLTRVLRSCAGKDGDFMFEKESVKITRAKEFICAPLFKNPRSSTNGWRTAENKDPKRCAIALGMTHILRPQRTTYVTAWQCGDVGGSCLYDGRRYAEEPNLWAEKAGPSEVQNEAPMEVEVEPLEERTTTINPSLPSLEQMRSMQSEEVP
ncbi:hypothetical protein AXG93_4846s1070 [Marchantia polymorpha subsp. ruderalis]|uniref:Uncharacterized protein n=1 Tax=Marchantia polymorpha subsp. ruderalis TaxID=1480154 RepID=A0A176VDS2_MARPO|nr:hypothetical protein AXG93_4846s1070 [Marchantia polymorpha subsp. ruderalis]